MPAIGHRAALPPQSIRTTAGGLALTVFMLTASACGWWPFGGDLAGGSPRPLPFTDIGLPEALDIDEDDLQVAEWSGGRTGLMKVSGDLGAEAIRNFYLADLPARGWTRIAEFSQGGRTRLIYKKELRALSLTIDQGWFGCEVEIHVSAQQ